MFSFLSTFKGPASRGGHALSNEPTPTFERQVHPTWHLSPPGRCLLPAACYSSMLLGDAQSGPVKLQILYYSLYMFLANLFQLEKENKFHYVVVARLLLAHTRPHRRKGALLGCRWVPRLPTMRGRCSMWWSCML